MDPATVALLSGVAGLLGKAITNKPYGIVHKSHDVTIGGKKGLLVWDYILWNELTFEEMGTGNKHSLYNMLSNKKAEEYFNYLVEKHGN